MTHDEDNRMEQRAARLSAMLAAADGPVPALAFPGRRIAQATRRRAVTRWGLAAAAVLAITVIGVSPVRAWVVSGAGRLWGLISGTASAERHPPVAPAADPSASRVAFVPAPGVFTVRIAARQAAGRLRVSRTSEPAVTAGSPGRTAAPGEWLVLPDGLSLANAAGATADYEVRVPSTVTQVIVRIGAEPARVLVPAADLPANIDVKRGSR